MKVPTASRNTAESHLSPIRRSVAGVRGQTNIEVFFDLVYAFAITQLSHHLLENATPEGALDTALLLAMAWLVWFYTSGVTNWLNPNHPSVRLLLVALMIASLIMSASIPDAFGNRGLTFAVAFAAMQTGRAAFAVVALRHDRLQANFARVLAWSIVTGAIAIGGGLAAGHVRELLWFGVVAIEVVVSSMGLWFPGLGRSTTRDWDIEGSHLAERSQSFVMIAIGESIIVVGAGLAGRGSVSLAEVFALAVAFAGSVAIWWVYFDRAAESAERVMAESPDPGRLGRSAYGYLHPIMIGGIIAVAAGDAAMLRQPTATAGVATSTMLVGGAALFLAGHAWFKYLVWHHVPWTRLAGILVLVLFAFVGPRLPGVAEAGAAALVIAAVALADWIQYVRTQTRLSSGSPRTMPGSAPRPHG